MSKERSFGCFSFFVIALILLVIILATHGCASSKNIEVKNPNNGALEKVEFQPYGLFNKDDMENPMIKYKIVVGNVVWSILLCETIIAPIVLCGYYLYEPVGVAPTNSSYYKGATGYITPVKTNRQFNLKIEY